MLDSLRFVQGAVSKKDFRPELTHFRISNGAVRGYNGTIALSSPIPLDIACNPQAEPLVKAIQACQENVAISLLPTGRLSIKSGAFRAMVACLSDAKFETFPEGDYFEINGTNLLKGLETIAPFLGSDASRPWGMSALLLNQSVFATNNVIVVEYWLGFDFPVFCSIPKLAIQELLRIGLPPIAIQASATSVTFHFGEDKWLRTQLFDCKAWPDLHKILDKDSAAHSVDKTIFEACRTVRPFADKIGMIYFTDGQAHTHLDTEQGAQYQIVEQIPDSAYNLDMLLSLENVVKEIDFSTYPKPCLFYGDNLRGAIIGAIRHAA
jgi:DNA polymerase III sliding clamp (beta) subunit (PCNA family)